MEGFLLLICILLTVGLALLWNIRTIMKDQLEAMNTSTIMLAKIALKLGVTE